MLRPTLHEIPLVPLVLAVHGQALNDNLEVY